VSYNQLRTIVREEDYDIMDDDPARSAVTVKRRPRPGWAARLALVGLLASVGLLAAACGGGSQDPRAVRVASTTAITTTTVAPSDSSRSGSPGEASQSEQLQFAQCMRSHGVPNYPDPSPTGGTLNAISAAGINSQSPSFQSAVQACQKYNPAANRTPAESAAENAEGLEISQCMRSHGVPNFPDPRTGPLGEQVINMLGLGIDPSSPTYQAASAACQKLYPGSK
jgi:hypothetical protein